jgi:hypothetical protein
MLVLQVDKLFQGKTSDLVYKFYNSKKKDETKFQEEIKEEVKGYEAFRQPFLFGFHSIYKQTNDKIELNEGTQSIKELYLIDHSKSYDYLKFITNHKKNLKVQGKIEN